MSVRYYGMRIRSCCMSVGCDSVCPEPARSRRLYLATTQQEYIQHALKTRRITVSSDLQAAIFSFPLLAVKCLTSSFLQVSFSTFCCILWIPL